MRPYHLDYLDADTLEYYLQAPRHTYDVAILFYAQWDDNSHAFAPLWDHISKIHQAGTEASNLIMGLFDCEQNARHSDLCTQVGVRHYPTIAFFSLSGQGVLQVFRKPHHVTQFGGDWRYGDAVYDWLKTMSGLSKWHRLGWGKKLRSMIFFGKSSSSSSPKDRKLPLGIPAGGASGTTPEGGIPSSFQQQQSSVKEKQIIEALEAQVQEYREVTTRSATFLDALMFPLSTGEYLLAQDTTKNTTDIFALLHATDGWTSTDDVDVILKSCTMEVSLDYCSRFSDNLANDWVNQQTAGNGIESITEEVIATFTTYLTNTIQEQEPYCTIVEECILSNYAKEDCTPPTCPFRDVTACRYLSACLDSNLQHDYAKALNLTTTTTHTADGTSTTTTNEPNVDGSTTQPQKKWGL
jgi:hypothetical protein